MVATLLPLLACVSTNPYESAKLIERAHFKKVAVPFRGGTEVYLSQGAFGKASHSEQGNEYSWDFNVPYGTDVLAVENGKVLDIWAPAKGGGCDKSYADVAHNVKIEAMDGTVAQYVHVDSKVKLGQIVKKGDVVAVTAKNGFICEPQLHFGIYQAKNDLYSSTTRKTLPLSFNGIPEGIAKEGMRFVVK